MQEKRADIVIMNPLSNRQSLRKHFRQLRRELSEKEQNIAREQVLRQSLNAKLLQKSNHVAVYLANDGEISCQAIIHWCWRENKRVYLPVLDKNKADHLLFYPYTADSALKPNKFGIPEPEQTRKTDLSLSDLDVILMPLVAFDERGNRLGMGGGFYDRTLAPLQGRRNTSPLLCGIAHDCQQADTLDHQKWDIPMHKIITPSRVISVKSGVDRSTS